uniref:ribonuclease H n=1 Tax=Leptobrachium leishanense TaxID=445787 RepID=A0A8C5LRY4_9ANUR
MISIMVGGEPSNFMIDTGATLSVMTHPIAPLSGETATIIGATGTEAVCPFLSPRVCSLGGHQVSHQFLYMPDCPIQLIGRDLLSKMQAQITFLPEGQTVLTLPEFKDGIPHTQENSSLGKASVLALVVPQREEWRIIPTQTPLSSDPMSSCTGIPGVWAEDNPPGLALNIPPVYVDLKPDAQPIALRQYHIPQKAKQSIQIHFERLLKYGILKFCVSPWNTPLLPVQKENTQEYRPVQDLRAVNSATVTLHPVVPNPYNLLALIPADTKFYTVLDLKDAFFCIRLAPASQPLFAFQWEDAKTGAKHQMAWTRLPQGFKNSPTIYGSALSQDLLQFNSQPGRAIFTI